MKKFVAFTLLIFSITVWHRFCLVSFSMRHESQGLEVSRSSFDDITLENKNPFKKRPHHTSGGEPFQTAILSPTSLPLHSHLKQIFRFFRVERTFRAQRFRAPPAAALLR